MSTVVKVAGVYLAVGAAWTGYVYLAGGKNIERGVVTNLFWWPRAVLAAVVESKLFGAA